MPTTTLRMDQDTLARLDGLAQAQGRSRAFVIKEAVDRYLDYEEWFVAQVKQGLEDVEQGRIASRGEVREVFARFGVDAG